MKQDISKIRAIIVEDERLILDRIRSLLSLDEQIQIVAECVSGSLAVQEISKHKPDLLFLDIQLPVYDGFQVLESIPPLELPEVIIISAFDQFALRAFDYDVMDYLLKPFDKRRFFKALQKAKERIGQVSAYQRYFIARKGEKSVIVHVHDVVWIQSSANYVLIYVDDDFYKLRSTLSQIESILDPTKFRRIHRSHIISIEKIKELSHLYQGDYSFTMINGKVLTSSSKYRENIKYILQKQ